MSDPIPGKDSNAAYDVVPSGCWPKDWWTVTCNGIPVRHFVIKANAERYATDAEYRAQPDSGEVCRPLNGRDRRV
jgi:hypothetical protein